MAFKSILFAFVLVTLGVLSLPQPAHAQATPLDNCDHATLCFNGQDFRVWVTSARLRGQMLVVTIRYLNLTRSYQSIDVAADSGGFVEILDFDGNIYRADEGRLINQGVNDQSLVDMRFFFILDGDFRPPFDLSIRSARNGSSDIINIPAEGWEGDSTQTGSAFSQQN